MPARFLQLQEPGHVPAQLPHDLQAFLILQNFLRRVPILYWKVAYPDVYLSAKDTNRAADLKVQLDYAVETWTAEFITGSKSVEADYDAFLNEIQKLGEEYLAIYQAAYAK